MFLQILPNGTALYGDKNMVEWRSSVKDSGCENFTQFLQIKWKGKEMTKCYSKRGGCFFNIKFHIWEVKSWKKGVEIWWRQLFRSITVWKKLTVQIFDCIAYNEALANMAFLHAMSHFLQLFSLSQLKSGLPLLMKCKAIIEDECGNIIIRTAYHLA